MSLRFSQICLVTHIQSRLMNCVSKINNRLCCGSRDPAARHGQSKCLKHDRGKKSHFQPACIGKQEAPEWKIDMMAVACYYFEFSCTKKSIYMYSTLQVRVNQLRIPGEAFSRTSKCGVGIWMTSPGKHITRQWHAAASNS